MASLSPWNLSRIIRRAGFVFLIAVIYYVLFVPSHIIYHTSSEHISGVQPAVTWEFMADINNLKSTNPNVLSFHIVDDLNDHGSWVFKALITEKLPYFGEVGSQQTFTVKQSNNDYLITILIKACKYFICVDGTNAMTFTENRDSKGGVSTQMTSSVRLKWPLLLGALLAGELEANHKAWINNVRGYLERRG